MYREVRSFGKTETNNFTYHIYMRNAKNNNKKVTEVNTASGYSLSLYVSKV